MPDQSSSQVDRLVHEARTLTREAFVEKHDGLFLRSKASASSTPADTSPIAYQTRHVDPQKLEQTALANFLQSAWIHPIAKRPENPFRSTVSVGRAPNCDIVLRLPFVSKLHARFSFEDPQRVTVSDNDSANGTRVNGRLLKSPETCAIGPGDTVTFGSLELEVVSAQMAYEWLRSTPR